MNQTPTVGRIVHYQAYGTPGGEHASVPRAAIITNVVTLRSMTPSSPVGDTFEYIVSLCVLNPTGMFFNERVPFSETPKPGHWNWPPRT